MTAAINCQCVPTAYMWDGEVSLPPIPGGGIEGSDGPGAIEGSDVSGAIEGSDA
jgi:hypothetical protein